MNATINLRRTVLLSALATTGSLIGGLFVAFLLGSLVHGGLPGHMEENAKTGVSALVALVFVIAAGALWGRAITRITRAGDQKRMMWAGALGFGPTVIAVGIVLTMLEVAIVERGGGPALPIHTVFTLLFTPAAFVIATMGGLAIGIAMKDAQLMVRLALSSGLAAGVTFLVVDLLMDAVGYRVGAPGAAERFTMLTVMFLGNLAASLTGGAAIGYMLAKNQMGSHE
ncbi:hypothetical protein ANRL1_03113 [Anaerolineae bacterium]|nr:hypothetical protein ANRL1_03113 [Anaerolineae bacterium]